MKDLLVLDKISMPITEYASQGNAISGLRTRELIDGKTLIKASDKLFG